MSITFLPSKFPANDVTDGQYLYRSLGYFWTKIFEDKQALKGYTTGMAEELIQSYYNLLETLKQYSVKEIDLFHKEKWKHIVIKKSEFNNAPFVFEPSGAVFGIQPSTDKFYANQLFRFGYSKQTDGKTFYSYTPSFSLKKFSVIANRIISPSFLQINGVDVVLSDGALYFNSDLFENQYIPKSKLIGDDGKVITFQDQTGVVHEDEFIVLWLYHSEIDEISLYQNFGALFDLTLPSSKAYKEVLKSLMNLSVEGATITALNTALAALYGTPVIIESFEFVEELITDDKYNYVVTDKNIYKLPIEQELANYVQKGNKLTAGTSLSSDVQVMDTITNPFWWKNSLETKKLAFASHVFAVGNKSQLFFENAQRDITYIVSENKTHLNFPVLGRTEDVESFQVYINHPTRKQELLKCLHIAPEGSTTVRINPLDFVFENIFKNNTLLLKLAFRTVEQLKLFFALLPTLQKYLPAHVYILVYLRLQLPNDEHNNLNSCLTIAKYPNQVFSADGSDPLTGKRPGTPNLDENYYKDYINRVFCVSIGPYKNVIPQDSSTKAPLHVYDNLLELSVNNSTDSTTAGVCAGKLRTEIPRRVRSPGESTNRRPSTQEIPSIFLIDF
jgi:hypothetical protein